MSSRLNPSEIASVIIKQIDDFDEKLEVRETGRVLEVGDGIARCYGLSEVMAGELVDFPEADVKGQAFNLEDNALSVSIPGSYPTSREGREVRPPGHLLSVPVADALVGGVVDPLGNPLDGKGPILTTHRRPIEFTAPGIVERQPVKTPLQTGIKA